MYSVSVASLPNALGENHFDLIELCVSFLEFYTAAFIQCNFFITVNVCCNLLRCGAVTCSLRWLCRVAPVAARLKCVTRLGCIHPTVPCGWHLYIHWWLYHMEVGDVWFCGAFSSFCFMQACVSAGEVKLAKHWLKKAYKIPTTPEETAKVIKLFKAGMLKGVRITPTPSPSIHIIHWWGICRKKIHQAL